VGRFAERRSVGAGAGSVYAYPARGEDLASYPTLVEFLTLDRFNDGTPRVPGTVMLFVEDGRLKVCFNDRQEQVVGFVCVDSLETLLDDLEKLLEGDRVEFRVSKAGRGDRKK
jgi:hypothetical protein